MTEFTFTLSSRCLFPMMSDIIQSFYITLWFVFFPLFIFEQTAILSYINTIVYSFMSIHNIKEVQFVESTQFKLFFLHFFINFARDFTLLIQSNIK